MQQSKDSRFMMIYTRPLQNKNTKSNNRGAKSEPSQNTHKIIIQTFDHNKEIRLLDSRASDRFDFRLLPTSEASNRTLSARQLEGEAQVEEEQPRNRRRVQVILAQPSSSSVVEEDSKVRDSHERSNKRPSENGRPEESNDLRNKLRRKSQTIDHVHDSKNDLRSIIEESKAKRVEDSSVQPQLKPRVLDLRDQLNSKSEDLRIKLNRPNRSDLQ
ncbi:hypothetical protein F2Q68_00016290 [Brassica cretica]|uniref:Uncharacterized protein n=1 Tax=Brassica cretica TaxID=69181 RepID=A0A8S9HID8_BRACR|nr:hypothetical protein F2Q68_00016290 [Brassica cretica]